MNYKNKYKEALEIAKKIHNETEFDYEKGMMEEIFPELAESEDARIMKGIESVIKHYGDEGEVVCPYPFVTIEEALAWLEKQEKPQGKPAFEVGDWIISHYNHVAYIKSIDEKYYILSCNDGNCERLSIDYVNRNWRLWTIQDAKEGDVIYLPNGNNEYYFFIFKGIENAAVKSFAHFYQYNDGTSKVEGTIDKLFSVNDVFKPATKEQRDILFQEMHEAGYMWDDEKKELKKSEHQRMVSAEAKEAMYSKPAVIDIDKMVEDWKSKTRFYGTSDMLAYRQGLNDAIGKIVPKPTWSEEDEKMWLSAIEYVRTYPAHTNSVVDWLKSLKQRIGE